MEKRLDEFMGRQSEGLKPSEVGRRRKKRLKPTSLDSFLPEEHVDYFKKLRIGSKKIRNARVEEL
ncbi:MAG: hypothetical protein PWQ79_433 [Thermococcaceae archaeon]|nr:hypothetical protein [Thermococcaceae archaeon]MDK2913518.1 hypothetical protein [Thermococcaceae archaeon]